MSKPTKKAVIDRLEKMGVEHDPEDSYDNLVIQLKEAEEGDVEVEEAEEVVENVVAKEEPARLNNEVKEEPRLEQEDTAIEEEKEDYLQQYQYRKDAAFGSIGSNPVPGSKAEKMKANLLAQPRVSIVVPREKDEDPTIKHSINLNGYRLDLPKDAYVELPRQIAEVIVNSLKQTNAAIQRNQIGADKEAALS